MQGGTSTSAFGKEQTDESIFRVTLLGESAVGKSALLRRFSSNSFDMEYSPTLGSTSELLTITFPSPIGKFKSIQMQVWDMGGQATYRELRRQFIKGSAGGFLVYDVTRPETFMAMNHWYTLFREVCPNSPLVICANKVDLKEQRMVPVEPGIMLRDWFQCEYYETSARTGQSVEKVFTRLAELLAQGPAMTGPRM